MKRKAKNEMKLEIVYLPTEQLTPYENNAKIHTEEQIEQIVKSIQEFGMNDPIGIWGENNLIIEGHGRLEACKKIGMKEVPCIRLDDLTDEQRRAYTLAHNQLTMNTGFNLDMLQAELDSITEIDMSEFGFDEMEEPTFEELEDGEGIEDNADEPVAVKITFKNAREWRENEMQLRDLVDTFDGVRVSVAGDED